MLFKEAKQTVRYVIIGGEFVNKGAEAMLIGAVNSVKRYDKDAMITALIGYGEIDKKIVSGLEIDALLYTVDSIDVLLDLKKNTKYVIKNTIKHIIHKKGAIKICAIKKAFTKADYVIDISGYGLTSRWPLSMNNLYLDRISLAVKLNPKCKVVLLPQSFGPFSYSDPHYNDKIKRVLEKCYLIYARESVGYRFLKEMGLNNVKKSYDSVLLSTQMNIEELENTFSFTPIKVESNAVGIIPNIRIFDKTGIGEQDGIKLYASVIKRLLITSNKIYLLPHSGEDIESCREIKELFYNDDRVVFVNKIYHSYEFQYIAGQFKYIIASRFHSIVHAYKESTPAIIIGWAEKYEELAEAFEQKKYIISINDSMDIMDAVLDLMEENYIRERERISHNMAKVQETDCFEFLDDKSRE